MKLRLLLPLVSILGAGALSCSSSSTSTPPPADFTVVVKNYSFTPADLKIKKGQTVEWVIQQGTHDITSGPHTGTLADAKCNADGKFTSGEPQSSGAYRFTFNDPGTYPYFCTPHCAPQNQFGTITVTP